MDQKKNNSFYKENFKEFLKKLYLENKFSLFENYLELLYLENQKVNLISRNLEKNDYWTNHFEDSLFPLTLFDFSGKDVLDFGTGGGLPSIPIKLVSENMNLVLLDSIGKKIKCLQNILKILKLKNCVCKNIRLEDYKTKNKSFDIIVCRAVKILPKYKNILFSLLKKNGKILLYKGKEFSDVEELFDNYKIHNYLLSNKIERNLIEVVKP